MKVNDVVRDIHARESDLKNYERKYGVLPETFYEAYQSGEEPAEDAWVMDWSDWSGAYEIWLHRREQYREMIRTLTAKHTCRTYQPICPPCPP
jgi:hypothetical protein